VKAVEILGADPPGLTHLISQNRQKGARPVTFKPDSPLVAEVLASPNFERRRGPPNPSILLLHYTGLASCETAIDWLRRSGSKVSCHYVVDESGRITQMVAEEMRAWHAGVSYWAGERDINSASIGIEIHNPGHEAGYPDFTEPQMSAVEALGRDIVARNGIRPERVLAHSDVAPARKSDPGEKFDWRRLGRAGLGHWIEPAPYDPLDRGAGLGDSGPLIAGVQSMLSQYGYGIEPMGDYEPNTEFVVKAFQRHFRPARVDGRLDQSTITTLERLLAALSERAQLS
jgi:N-acetylmuramoyl-L-alanine amidase